MMLSDDLVVMMIMLIVMILVMTIVDTINFDTACLSIDD